MQHKLAEDVYAVHNCSFVRWGNACNVNPVGVTHLMKQEMHLLSKCSFNMQPEYFIYLLSQEVSLQVIFISHINMVNI